MGKDGRVLRLGDAVRVKRPLVLQDYRAQALVTNEALLSEAGLEGLKPEGVWARGRATEGRFSPRVGWFAGWTRRKVGYYDREYFDEGSCDVFFGWVKGSQRWLRVANVTQLPDAVQSAQLVEDCDLTPVKAGIPFAGRIVTATVEDKEFEFVYRWSLSGPTELGFTSCLFWPLEIPMGWEMFNADVVRQLVLAVTNSKREDVLVASYYHSFEKIGTRTAQDGLRSFYCVRVYIYKPAFRGGGA